MQKKPGSYLAKKQEWNLSDDQEEGFRTDMHLFPTKFIKELNFLQNCQKIRQRRIKKINRVFQLRGTILQNLKQERQKEASAKEAKTPSSDNLKEIYYKGNVIKGRLKKRLLHGDTQIIYQNGAEFKGVFKNGTMRTGKFDFKNGYEYWGQLEGKHFIGKGTLKCPNGSLITGVWNKDQLIGRAEIQYKTGDVYYGEVKKFQKHGQGYLFFKSGNKYIGSFENGQITGMGTYFKTDGTSDKGYWKNGELLQPDSQINTKTENQNTSNPSVQNSEVQNNYQAGQTIMPNVSDTQTKSATDSEKCQKTSQDQSPSQSDSKLTSQSDEHSDQSDKQSYQSKKLTSQTKTLTSQSKTLTSQSKSLTSRSKTLTSQSDKQTSQTNIWFLNQILIPNQNHT